MDPTKLQYIGQTKPLIKSLRMQYVNRAAASVLETKILHAENREACIKFQKRTFYRSWLQICANTFEVKAPPAQLVPPIQEAFSKNRTYLYATNKYKKSGPMLYLIIHTHDVNTEGLVLFTFSFSLLSFFF